MSAVAVNSLMQAISKNQPYTPITKMPPPIVDRNHYSAPSGGGGGGYHMHTHSHSSHGGGGKHSIALTALTLLSFLFFLNILQNCLQEHMDSMNPEQQQKIIVLSRLKAGKEAQKRKSDDQAVFINSTLKLKNSPEEAWKSAEKIYTSINKGMPGMIKKIEKKYEIKKP